MNSSSSPPQQDLSRSNRSLNLEKVPFYKIPHPLFNWGESPPVLSRDWSSLFFDLVIVSALQKASNLLTNGINEFGTLTSSLLFFVAILILTHSMWIEKVSFDARYAAEDIFHNLAVLLYTLGIAVIAWIIPDQVDSFSYVRITSMIAIITFFCTMFAIMHAELWFQSLRPKDQIHEPSRLYGKGFIAKMSLLISLLVICLVCSAFESMSREALAILLSCWALNPLFFLLLRCCGKASILGGVQAVPIHIEFFMIRQEDFTLLCFGESIIQLTTVPFSFEPAQVGGLLLAYIILALIALLHFTTIPKEPAETAYRRSAFRALISNTILQVYYIVLVALGAGFSSVLQNPVHSPAWVLCTSLALTFFILSWVLFLHRGVHEEFLWLSKSQLHLKIVLWILQGVVIGGTLCGPLTGFLHWQLLAYLALCSLMFMGLKIFDFQYFWVSHCEAVQAELIKNSTLVPTVMVEKENEVPL